MKIVTILGARPQFVKAATVSRVIAGRPDITEVIVHTGQHYDPNMSDIFFSQLEIPAPHHNLGIGGGLHGAMTGRQLEAVETVLLAERPDWVLVYGDTNSTLAGALAAAKLHIPVAHVEAGLRSFNRRMPEEINRILTDHAADLLFAPTRTAVSNLAAEGLGGRKVRQVGDVMYDAALFYRGKAAAPSFVAAQGLRPGAFVLATVHRAENTDDPQRLGEIMRGFAASPHPIVLPLHPRTRARLDSFGVTPPAQVLVVEPVGYLEMLWLLSQSALVLTDSGGVQKEAYFFGKPCVTLRGETEWVELVEAGWNILVGTDPERIAAQLSAEHRPPAHTELYGAGDAAERIVADMAGG